MYWDLAGCQSHKPAIIAKTGTAARPKYFGEQLIVRAGLLDVSSKVCCNAVSGVVGFGLWSTWYTHRRGHQAMY